MSPKVGGAVGSAVASMAIALGASLGVASATEGPHGGQCNDDGNNDLVVAPFCGTSFTPPPTITTEKICFAIYPPLPGCPGYPGP